MTEPNVPLSEVDAHPRTDRQQLAPRVGDPAPSWLTARSRSATSAGPTTSAQDPLICMAILVCGTIVAAAPIWHFCVGTSLPRRPAGHREPKRGRTSTCQWSSTPRLSAGWTSALVPNRRHSHPPALGRSSISPATGTGQSPHATAQCYRLPHASCSRAAARLTLRPVTVAAVRSGRGRRMGMR